MRLYRFRSNNEYTKDEILNNYFYFALPQELNDPMEGFIKLYWDGDLVLWKNFIKHYLYTMANSVFNSYIDPKSIKQQLPIFFDEEHYPSNEFKAIFEEIRDYYFSQTDVIELLDCLQVLNSLKIKITIKILECFMNFISKQALYSIILIFNKHNILNWNMSAPGTLGIFKKFKELLPQVETEYPGAMSVLFEATNTIQTEFSINFKMEYEQNTNEMKNFFFLDYHKLYLQQIKHILFSVPCTTCFMERNDLPSLWGYYGDNHKGICLIFDDENPSSKEIKFNLLPKFKNDYTKNISISASTMKVKYKNQYIECNFFEMLGNIPLKNIDKSWLCDWNGNSTTFLSFKNSFITKSWIKKYNKTYFTNCCIKLPDWKKEREHRIVLQKDLVCGNTKDERKFNYDFMLLKGIVFGFRMPEEERIKLINIIQKKCDSMNRKDFKFYQAVYNEKTGLIYNQELKI